MIEVLGVKGPDVGGHIRNELTGQDLAGLEQAREEERLQDASRAARRGNDVDMLSVVVSLGGGEVAQVGHHLSGLHLDDEGGRVSDPVLVEGPMMSGQDLGGSSLYLPLEGRTDPGARVPGSPPSRG